MEIPKLQLSVHLFQRFCQIYVLFYFTYLIFSLYLLTLKKHFFNLTLTNNNYEIKMVVTAYMHICVCVCVYIWKLIKGNAPLLTFLNTFNASPHISGRSSVVLTLHVKFKPVFAEPCPVSHCEALGSETIFHNATFFRTLARHLLYERQSARVSACQAK